MSDVNIDHIEALVGPLPRRREWERWCEYTQPLSLPERGKADAAIAELKAENEALRRDAERGREWEKAVSFIWQLDGVGPKTLRACIDSMQDLITQADDERDKWETRARVLCFDSRSNLAEGIRRDMYAERGAVTDAEIIAYEEAQP